MSGQGSVSSREEPTQEMESSSMEHLKGFCTFHCLWVKEIYEDADRERKPGMIGNLLGALSPAEKVGVNIKENARERCH